MTLRARVVALACVAFVACPTTSDVDGGGGGAGGSSSTGGGAAGGVGGGAAGGSAGTGGGGVEDGGRAPEAFCTELANRFCGAVQRCGFSAQSTAACLRDKERACLKEFGGFDAGAVALDEVAAERCLTKLSTADCAAGGGLFPPSCAESVRAAGRLGSPCSFYTCREGYCPYPPPPSCSFCSAYRQLGDTCTTFNSCDPTTSYCPFALADGGVRHCEPQGDAGAPCTPNRGVSLCKDGASCIEFERRDGGLARCGPLATGTTCLDDSECGPRGHCRGLRFDQQFTLVAAGTCQPRIALGGTCADEMRDDGCSDGGTCLDGTCVLAPPESRLPGQACDDYQQCRPDSACVIDVPTDGGPNLRKGRCVANVGLDAGCDAYAGPKCAPPLWCGYESRRCRYLARAHEPCSTELHCADGLDCTSLEMTDGGRQCLAPRAAGQSCEYPFSTCVDAFCQDDAGVCSGLRDAGVACVNGNECASSTCANGTCTACVR